MAGMSDLKMFNKYDWMGLELFHQGYDKSPEALLLPFDLDSLNQNDFNFKQAQLKKVARQVSTTENGDQIQWYDQDIKEPVAKIDGATTNDEEFTLDVNGGSDPQVWETLFNVNTQKTYLVENVDGSTVTIEWTDENASDGDKIVRLGYSKKYGEDDSFVYVRQDASEFKNYFQWTEGVIDSDMITNNRNGLFHNPETRLIQEFSDISRKIVLDMVRSFYVGKRQKYTNNGDIRYTTWGILDYLDGTDGYQKYDIGGANADDDDDVKKNLRNRMQLASASGIGLTTDRDILCFCTTAFSNKIDDLYENKLVKNDMLRDIRIDIKEVELWANTLQMARSNVLDNLFQDKAVAFFIPLDHVFLYNLPKTTADASGRNLENFGKGLIYKKPQNTPEKSRIWLFTHWSNMFGGVSTQAYQFLEYTDPA